MDVPGTNPLHCRCYDSSSSGQGSDNNGYNGHSISTALIHKDEVIYRVPLMLSPTDSPLAVDNETSLNGVISH